MKRVIRSDDFFINKNEALFFDTNIWLNLFFPTGNHENQHTQKLMEKTGKIYKAALEKNAEIYTSSLVISEFINSYVRLIFKSKQAEDKLKYQDFKQDFRRTDEYEPYAKAAIEIIESILTDPCVKVLDDDFSKFDVTKICTDCNVRHFDYNDFYINELCRKRNIIIVTADSDFLLANIQNQVVFVN